MGRPRYVAPFHIWKVTGAILLFTIKIKPKFPKTGDRF